MHSTIQSAADNRESQESSKEGDCAPAITQRDSLHWSVIVQPFLPPESHQCYATSTPIGNEAARVRHLKAVRVLRQVGRGFNTLIASPETSHSRCRIYHLTCCLTLTSRPRCSISSPPAIASQRVPLSRPHSRWITVSCSWIAILFLHYLSLSTHPSHRPRLLASPRHPARVKESSLRIKGGECAHPAISKCMQNERAGGHLV